jgi:hypothetical protein
MYSSSDIPRSSLAAVVVILIVVVFILGRVGLAGGGGGGAVAVVTYLIGAGIAGPVTTGLTSSEPRASKRGTSEPKSGAARVWAGGVKVDQSNCESSSSRATFLGPRPASERRKIATSKIGLPSIS